MPDQPQHQTPEPVSPSSPTMTFKDLGIFLFKYVLALMVAGTLTGLAIPMMTGALRAHRILVLTAYETVIAPLLLLTLLLTSKRIHRPRVWVWRELRSPLAPLVVAAGIGLVVVAWLGILLSEPLTGLTSFKYMFKLIMETGPMDFSWTPLMVTVIGTGLLVPIAEEWALRGVIQRLLVQRWGAFAGVAVTSLLFVFLHGWDVVTLPAIGTLAVALGLLGYRRKSLTYCILLHVAFNLATVFPQTWRTLVYLKVL